MYSGMETLQPDSVILSAQPPSVCYFPLPLYIFPSNVKMRLGDSYSEAR